MSEARNEKKKLFNLFPNTFFSLKSLKNVSFTKNEYCAKNIIKFNF